MYIAFSILEMNKNCYDTYTCTCHQKRQRTFYTSLHCVVTETSMKHLDTFGEISQYTYTVVKVMSKQNKQPRSTHILKIYSEGYGSCYVSVCVYQLLHGGTY